jgi:hypothetical protein
MRHLLRSFATLAALTAACTTTGVGAWPAPATPALGGGPTPATPSGSAAAATLNIVGPDAHRGPGEWVTRPGARVEGVLHAGEEHAYIVELAGGEHLRWTIHGQSERSGSPRSCTHWDWSWSEPGGTWMNGGPLPIGGYDRSDPREDTADLFAQIPWSGDFKPLAGRWRYVVRADAGCAEIQYWITIEQLATGGR